MTRQIPDPDDRPTDRLVDAIFRSLIWLARRLPYERRVIVGGWVFSRLIAPLAGYRRRIRANLALVFPDMQRAGVRRLCRAVPDHIGRNLIELYSPEEFRPRAIAAPMTGAGTVPLNDARRANRPVVLVSGHFGNFNVIRAAFAARGISMAGLYRPMNNRFFNDHYVEAMIRIAAPLHPRDRAGMTAFIRHLRKGGTVAMLLDQRMAHGQPLMFFGHRAWTALSAAELALKFDALLLPIYAIRQENGLDFAIVAQAPIAHTTSEAMTQALNDSLEAMVRRHMDQWFWIHRRWAAPKAHHMPGGGMGQHPEKTDGAVPEPSDPPAPFNAGPPPR